ncbi:hypothetical protein L218DRAFT_1038855 [Marasmius fiardii PR-910]|nr:hypothetical protein L218DRAFT_1038855 [Marasmius fiardii PR-910]
MAQANVLPTVRHHILPSGKASDVVTQSTDLMTLDHTILATPGTTMIDVVEVDMKGEKVMTTVTVIVIVVTAIEITTGTGTTVAMTEIDGMMTGKSVMMIEKGVTMIGRVGAMRTATATAGTK